MKIWNWLPRKWYHIHLMYKTVNAMYNRPDGELAKLIGINRLERLDKELKRNETTKQDLQSA